MYVYCVHLLQGLFVPVDQQRPRLQQDAQCVLLNAVKQLLKCGGHLAVHLPPHLIININCSPCRGEEIGGVKELRGEDMRGKVKRGEEKVHKTVITLETFSTKPPSLSSSTSFAALSHNIHGFSSLLPSHHINVIYFNLLAMAPIRDHPNVIPLLTYRLTKGKSISL